MFSNPLIRRYCYSQFRPTQLWVFSILYLGILFLIFSINISAYQYQQAYSLIQDLYKGIFIQTAILQVLLLWIIFPMNCSSVIPREISEQSIDFFRMLPLSAFQKTIGILVGRNIFGWIIAGFNFCLCAVLGIVGDLENRLLFQLTGLLLSATAALGCGALLVSVLSYKKANRSVTLFVLIMALFGFGPIIGMLVSTVQHNVIDETVFFFTMEIPLLWLLSGYIAVTAVWFFIGILRRFTREYEPLFSRRGAVLFFINCIIFIYGLFYGLIQDSDEYLYAFYLVTLLPAVMIPFLSLRSFDRYIEYTRTARHRRGLGAALFLQSNFIFNMLLLAIWFACAAAVCYSSYGQWDILLQFAAALATGYLVVMLLLEIFVLYQSGNDKIGFLIGFLGGIYLIVPFIVAGVFDYEYFIMFSPLGLVGSFVDQQGLTDTGPVLILNGIVAALLLGLVGRKYAAAARLRAALEK